MTIRRPIIALLLLFALARHSAGAESSVDQITRQFREYCLHESTGRGERLLDDVELPKTGIDQAASLIASQREDGSWADIDYTSNVRSSWPPCTHLTRALALVVAARREENPAAVRAVHRAISWWKQHDYQCPNWWYNQIGVPKVLGTVALLLGNDLTADERTFIATIILPRAKVGSMTGQNRVWLAEVGAMRAALLGDETLMRQAAGVIQEEIRVGTGEGIQPDWSFHQHGPQQQFGNYGMAYAVQMSRWATILRGTDLAFSPEKLSIARNFLLDGENWVLWRGMMDISACGRQLFPDSPSRKASVIRGVMQTMALADESHAMEYRAVAARTSDGSKNDLVGNRYFWRSDYLVHRQADWSATLKMSSNRVIGGETVNSENLSGLLLADGATFFHHTGHEYDDIFPLWNWRMVPGTTTALSEGSLQWPTTADLKKGAAFVGGASDGQSGCAAMDFHRDALSAKKAWFFYGDVVVCLGSDITSTGTESVVTTVNQCLLNGPVTVGRSGKSEPVSGMRQSLQGDAWVEHDGFRYVPLDNGSLLFSSEERTGNWRKVFNNPATPANDVEQKIFSLWLDHGTGVRGGHYAYAVMPARTNVHDEIRIISNTPAMQAVKIGPEWTAAVFWSAGRADLDGLAVLVNAPCLMLAKGTGASRSVIVSEPTQKLDTLRLEMGGQSHDVKLPTAGDVGKSVVIDGSVVQ